MAAVSGTSVLLYYNGQPIAMQKGLSLSVNDQIIDTSNKDSAGWFDGISGMKDATINFNSLFTAGALTDNPKVLSATDLFAYITSRSRLLIYILDNGVPIVGEADMNSLAFDAPNEGAMAITGSLKVSGKLYALTGTMVQMITDPDAGGTDYDTLTVSGIKITSAIKSTGGAKYCQSNVISVADTGVYKLALYLTKNSGALPKAGIWDNTSAYISNEATLVEGLNLVSLTATATDASSSLRFTNTANANWSTSNIYLFKV